jgi:hypothetical protein
VISVSRVEGATGTVTVRLRNQQRNRDGRIRLHRNCGNPNVRCKAKSLRPSLSQSLTTVCSRVRKPLTLHSVIQPAMPC